MSSSGKRIAYLDLAKGICIVLVMFFHVKGIVGRSYTIDPFLTSFRLPLYFFLSGLFFRDYGGLGRFVRKKTNRLLVPFFAFYLFGSVFLPTVLDRLFGIGFSTPTGVAALWAFIWPGNYPNIPIWFLWCLFLVNVLFWLLRRLSAGITTRLCVRQNASGWAMALLAACCLLVYVAGSGLHRHFMADVGNLFKALESLPFFCLGYVVGQSGGLTALDSASRLRVTVSFVLFFAVCLMASLFVPHDSVGVFLVCHLLSGMSGALMVVALARLLRRVPLLSYLGRYSIIVLLTHGLLVKALTPLVHRLLPAVGTDVAVLAVLVLIALSYLLIIPFCCRYLPHVTAQKPLLPEA